MFCIIQSPTTKLKTFLNKGFGSLENITANGYVVSNISTYLNEAESIPMTPEYSSTFELNEGVSMNNESEPIHSFLEQKSTNKSAQFLTLASNDSLIGLQAMDFSEIESIGC
mmetsp:Transcript_2330/g.3317  ORF Transcript_2330/g.3317 Transcript_2330/m.3317 type:complete len:112 (-) Transcript_2330:8-343(-)